MGNLGLAIAASGIDAAQTAMDTIAQNLSNTNTPGYIAETANISALASGDPLGIGGGAAVGTVTQNSDGLLAANAAQTSANAAQSTALQQVLQQAQLAFGNPSSTTGVGPDLSTFWQSWDQLAANPSSSAGRQGVVDSAQVVVSDLQQASSQISTVSANAASQLAGTIAQANSLLGQVAALNSQITAQGATGSSVNALVDQRNQLLTQLSSQIGATSSAGTSGGVDVNVGGITLVQGNWSDALALQGAGGSTQVVAQSTNSALNAASGSAAGLLAAINFYLPSYKSQVDAVANNLASVVNTQLAAGFTSSGAPGSPLFTGSGAAGLAVNPAVAANPALIATAGSASLPAAANDGSNAQALASLYNSPNGPDAAWQAAVVNVGSQVSEINSQVQSQAATANTAQQNLQAVTGVNQNAALVDLMNFQSTYQAAAKVVTTVDTALQSLLAAV